MKSLGIVTLWLLSVLNGAAQATDTNIGKKITLSITVIDSLTRKSLSNASISFINRNTNKAMRQGLTDEKGSINWEAVPAGNYSILISYSGYVLWKRTLLLLDSIENHHQHIIAQLQQQSKILQNVVVTAPRTLVENRIDKIVYNAEKDISSQGGVATDILRKIPQVTVDADGNVELLGNSSILFLIDGKPSGIFANSVADALQSIPASQILKVEVMSSPSAKYDATGTGGVINIILKKSNVQGTSGNISLAAGSRLENGSVNLGWKKNNIGLSAYYSGNAQLNAVTPTGMDRVTSVNVGSNRLIQESQINFSRNGYKTGLSFDWNLDEQNSIALSAGLHHFSNRNNGLMNQQLISYDVSGIQLTNSSSLRDFTNNYSSNTIENAASLKHSFKKEKQALEIGYSGSFSNNNTYYNQTQFSKQGLPAIAGASSLNPGHQNAMYISIDYTHPFKNDVLLETGLKTGWESILSNADVYSLNLSTGIQDKDTSQSYRSDYRRKIYAAYMVLSFSAFKYFDIKAGGRFEYTANNAQYSNSGLVPVPSYNNLAPSVVVSHTFSNKQTIKFSYAYRLERPDYRDLNPFMNLSDPHNITTGNPNLQPEIGHNYHLDYNINSPGGITANLLLFYERNSPDIKPYITYYPSYKIGDSLYSDVTITSRADISAEVKTGVNLSLSIPFSKKLTVRSNIMVYDRHLRNFNETPNSINSIGFRTNLNANYQFNSKWVVECFGNYNLGMKWQGKQPNLFSYTLAGRKQFLHAKASVGFVLVNVFNKYIDQKTLVLSNNLVTNSYRNIPYRSFGISFTYKFGKLKFNKSKESENYLLAPPADN